MIVRENKRTARATPETIWHERYIWRHLKSILSLFLIIQCGWIECEGGLQVTVLQVLCRQQAVGGRRWRMMLRARAGRGAARALIGDGVLQGNAWCGVIFLALLIWSCPLPFALLPSFGGGDGVACVPALHLLYMGGRCVGKKEANDSLVFVLVLLSCVCCCASVVATFGVWPGGRRMDLITGDDVGTGKEDSLLHSCSSGSGSLGGLAECLIVIYFIYVYHFTMSSVGKWYACCRMPGTRSKREMIIWIRACRRACDVLFFLVVA